jgi:hypothetical protein
MNSTPIASPMPLHRTRHILYNVEPHDIEALHIENVEAERAGEDAVEAQEAGSGGGISRQAQVEREDDHGVHMQGEVSEATKEGGGAHGTNAVAANGEVQGPLTVSSTQSEPVGISNPKAKTRKPKPNPEPKT